MLLAELEGPRDLARVIVAHSDPCNLSLFDQGIRRLEAFQERVLRVRLVQEKSLARIHPEGPHGGLELFQNTVRGKPTGLDRGCRLGPNQAPGCQISTKFLEDVADDRLSLSTGVDACRIDSMVGDLQ